MVVKDWLELKSVYNIQVFLEFANFYWQFIQGFSKIVALLTSMLKIIESLDKPAPSKNNGSKSASSRNNDSKPVSKRNNGNSKVNRFSVSKNSVKHVKKSEKLSKSGKSKSKKISKSQNLAKLGKKLSKSGNSTNFNTTEARPKFLTPNARTIFNCLRLAFIEAPISWHFDLEYHIWIETNVSGYIISEMLSQLTSGTNPKRIVTKTDLSQWHLIAFFSRKMIPVETQYKTYNGKFLAIIKAFKIWRHHLESCKYKVFVLIDYNNLYCFIVIKNLSSRQVRWAQKLF